MNLKMNEAWEYKPTQEKIKDLKNEVVDLERQLADLTRERDTLRAMVELQNSKLERVAAVIERSGK